LSKKETEIIEEPELPSVKVIPLGGLEQIGMNITAFEYDDSISAYGVYERDEDMDALEFILLMRFL
jgi:ribonuclease J